MGEEADADWQDGLVEWGAESAREVLPQRYRRIKCDECGQNYVSKRGEICEGCAAYREHTGHF